MEVRGQNSDYGKPAQQRFKELREELARRDSARVRQARERLAELSERRQELQQAAQEEAARRAERAGEAQRALEGAKPVDRSSTKGDSIEISDAAREAAALAQEGDAREATRSERVAELKAAYEAGELNTPDRVAQAAQRILGAN